jgi:hypothetical protein
MTGDALSSQMLGWRKLLRSRPDLLIAADEEWARWIASQRAQAPDVSKPQLTIIAELSCPADLTTHIGLVQLLALRSIRCAPVLTFPTEDMALIATGQARREPWHGLVKIAAPAERLQLLKCLPADSPLVVFRGPAILRPQCLEKMFVTKNLIRLLSFEEGDAETESSDPVFLWGRGFFGRAGAYSQDDEVTPEPWTEESTRSSQLLAVKPAELGLCRTPPAPVPRNQWPKRASPVQLANSDDGAVNIPRVESGDELVIRLNRNPLPSTVVERRSARLCATDEPLKIRLPGEMLTPAPKLLRLETYKPNGRVVGTNLLVRVPPSRLEPWMLSAFLNRGGGGNPVIRAFAEGTGCRLAYAEDEPETLSEIPVVWGVLRDSDRILAQAKARLMYFFYIDHAYFDRGHGKSYRITRNRYEAGPIRKCPRDRIGSLDVEVRPWQKSGREIIVCPPTDYFMAAHDCADWLSTTLEALAKFTDRPIVIREKPKQGGTAVPLKAALKTAHALVTHSSNVAVEAACLGTPVFVNSASAAAPIGETDLSKIETPAYPDRDPWLAHMAYNQFSIDEIREGVAWQLLLELEEREFA